MGSDLFINQLIKLIFVSLIIAEERARTNHKRRRVPSTNAVINCDFYINLESNSYSTVMIVDS